MKTPNRIVETNDEPEQLSLHLPVPWTITDCKEPMQLSFEFKSIAIPYVTVEIDGYWDEAGPYDHSALQVFDSSTFELQSTEIVPTAFTEELMQMVTQAFRIPMKFLSPTRGVNNQRDALAEEEREEQPSETTGESDGDIGLLLLEDRE